VDARSGRLWLPLRMRHFHLRVPRRCLLSLFGSVFGLGLSIGIPLTQSNVTVAGSIGAKAKIGEGLPTYVRERLAGNQNFINQSGTLTVGRPRGPRSSSSAGKRVHPPSISTSSFGDVAMEAPLMQAHPGASR
jgi:hypothetical protein